MFAERGYATVSASDVAQHAGRASYIGGKRGLFITLVERLGPQIIEVIGSVPAGRSASARDRSPNSWLDWIDGKPADLAGDGRPE